MKLHRSFRRAAVLQVLAVLAAVCLLAVGLVGLVVYRTITVGGDIRAARNAVLKDLNIKCASKVEVTAHPLLVHLVRFGLSFAPIEPEARLAMKAFRGAEVGVYQLRSSLGVSERRAVFSQIDQRLAGRGWERTVAVLDGDDLVMVFTPEKELDLDDVAAFVVVLNGHDLVLVSGRGDLEPIVELVTGKMGERFSLPAFASLNRN